jgi:hypothetical protein
VFKKKKKDYKSEIYVNADNAAGVQVVIPENTLRNETLLQLAKMGRILAEELSAPVANVTISDCFFDCNKTATGVYVKTSKSA